MDAASVPVALLVLSTDGRVEDANALAAERLGTAGGPEPSGPLLNRLYGARLHDLVPREPPLFEDLQSRFGAGRPVRIERVLVGGAGRFVDVAAMKDGEGRVVVVLLDAGQRVALEEQVSKLQAALAQFARERDRYSVLEQELGGSAQRTQLVGSSAPILRMMDQVERVAPTDSTVLIHGETGAGKELVARAIHERSPRMGRAMVSVNCASLPESLIESELFGHERGAFTGADRQRIGKFELADGGTLFLDEIAELSLASQAKLLRVLQEGVLERVGGTESVRVDVRVVAATHRDLALQVQRGRFREDLFYRLNVFRIDVPPLRDRREDIRALAEYFHAMHARRMARPVLPISERSMRRLLAYRWPGNVRELENTIERATLLSGGPELEVEVSQGPLTPGEAGGIAGAVRDTSSVPRDVLLDLTMDQLQRLQIMHALETRGYRVFGEGGAAERLGIHPQTLLSRMDKLGIPRPRLLRAAAKRQRSS